VILVDSLPNARLEWLTRRTETHCVNGPRQVTGADIVRISRTLAVEPWRFTQTAPAALHDRAGIELDKGRRRVTLSLATANNGCLFLIRAGGGSGRCGLGDLAPLCCRIFPADPSSSALGPAGEPTADATGAATHEPVGVPTDVPTGGATDRAGDTATAATPPSGLTADELTEQRRVWAADQAHWQEVVARWNALARHNRNEPLTNEDFQRYLLEAQAAREAGTDWPEEVSA
jgi:hypothetical protein